MLLLFCIALSKSYNKLNQANKHIHREDAHKSNKISPIEYAAKININSEFREAFSYKTTNKDIFPLKETATVKDKKPFTLTILVNYGKCKNYETQSIPITDIKQHDIYLTDNDIPKECIGLHDQKSADYKVCADLSSLPEEEYEISYITLDGHVKVAFHGMNEETSKSPFTITSYLTKSPGCNTTWVELPKLEATTSFQCIKVTIDKLPAQCQSDNSKKDSKAKTKKILIIVGIVLASIVLILAIIGIVYLAMILKRQKTLQSQALNVKLIADNEAI